VPGDDALDVTRYLIISLSNIVPRTSEEIERGFAVLPSIAG
jgi:hypothetical protein